MSKVLLATLRKQIDLCDRLYALERADLDRQIKALERSKPMPPATRQDSRDNELRMLKVMQAAKESLPPREIASRLGETPHKVSQWLAAAKKRGFVERVDGARYRVVKEVPSL
jgi:predicted Rossmann fold nucleotide-binding protein DprA/Smf involved in DNA uptake